MAFENGSLFQFNWHAVPVVLVSTVIFLVGLFIFAQNPRAITNRSFFLICLCVNAWLYGLAMVYFTVDPVLALNFYRYMTFLGVSFVSTCVYFFSTIWLGLYEKQKKWVVAGFLSSALFYLLGWVKGVGFTEAHYFYWGYYPKYGISSRIFIIFFFSYFLFAFYNFIQAYRSETLEVRKTQIRLIAIGFLISLTGSVDYIPKLFDISIYPIGYISVFTWIMLVAYSIVRYRVMDIQTVIHKTIMWLATSAIFGLPFVLFSYLGRKWLLNLHPVEFVGVIAGLYVLFLWYAKKIQPKIDHLFQRREWDLNRALERFNDELVHLRNIDEVVAHILKTTKDIFYIEMVSLLIREGDFFINAVSSKDGIKRNFTIQHPFLSWLEVNDKVVIREYLEIDPRLTEIAIFEKEYFDKSQIEICVPLVVNKKLIGTLNLGRKKNLQPYRAHDINFLSDLRRSAAIALSNALHIIAMQENLRKWNEELEKKVDERTKQLQETQGQLVQAEKLATIGTLAGGVAHEINNPLTAVLANAQLLKMSANPDDMESLDLIEEGAKRCQAIVQKLMNYARKPIGPEALAKVDIHKVIDSTIAFLDYQLKQENIRLVVGEKSGIGLIEGNSNELEQVFTNLILNAKDAIKQTNREGLIRITTAQHNGAIRIAVEDNGTGISENVLSKIFDPFFTTKAMGKGTGLGLAVTYGIVQKHNGKIKVESNLGQGATFFVDLPAGGSNG